MKQLARFSLFLALALLLALPGIQAQSAPDPWARAVAFPTACYQSKDPFDAKAQTAAESLAADIAKQEAINSKLNAQPTNTADAFAMAQRMQEMMMKDPQAAMKNMQQMGVTDPAAVTAAGAAQTEKRTKWDADEKALKDKYQAAHKQWLEQLYAQRAAVDKKVGDVDKLPAWAVAEYEAVERNHDKVYATTLCPQWFGPTGQFTAFARRFKDYLVTDRIPADEQVDAQKVGAYAMMNSGTGFKSVAALKGVEDYIKLMQRFFIERETDPSCTAVKCN